MSTKQEVADRVSAYLQHGGLIERIVADAVYWHWRYDESNPDVGWGPRMTHMVDEHIEAHKLKGVVDKDEVLRLVKQATGE